MEVDSILSWRRWAGQPQALWSSEAPWGRGPRFHELLWRAWAQQDTTYSTPPGCLRFCISSCFLHPQQCLEGRVSKAIGLIVLINSLINLGLHCVFVAPCGPSLVAVNGGSSWLRCTGFS